MNNAISIHQGCNMGDLSRLVDKFEELQVPICTTALQYPTKEGYLYVGHCH